MTIRILVAAACAAICLPATAMPGAIEPVVVTATRTATSPDAVLGSTEIIGADVLERLPVADVGEALRFTTGVEIARLGGPGQQTSLFMRGTESNHVLVLVDGVRINPATIGSAALQNIPVEIVERIEVVKGPRSALYGSDAIGGVVNVITRRPERSGVAVQAGLGSYDTQSAALSAALAGNAIDAGLDVAWLDSAGFPTRSDDTVDRGYRNLSVAGSLRGSVGAIDLAARAWTASGTSEYSDFFVTPVDQDFENSTFALEAATAPTGNWRTRATLGHAIDRLEQNQSDDLLRTRRWQLDWQNDIELGERHLLTAGVLLQDETATSLSFGLGFEESTRLDLYYLQDQVSLGRHRLLLAAGYTDHDTFGGETTWNAEWGVMLGQATSVTLAAGTAFRAPDATDRYGFGGNPDLAPETSQSIEASLRHRLGDRHALVLTLFRNDIDDLIQYVVTDPVTFEGENRNVERARIEGIEASWTWTGEAWRTRAGLTLQDPRDLGNDTRLLRRARENLTLSVARSIGPHEVAVDALAAGERLDFGFPEPVRLDSYVLANVSARFALTPQWSMTARVENLLDEQYELARGFNTMDRSLFITLRREFR